MNQYGDGGMKNVVKLALIDMISAAEKGKMGRL